MAQVEKCLDSEQNLALVLKHKVGILHVKCAVADGEWLFLSSANLKQQAFTINMELGMLVRVAWRTSSTGSSRVGN